ncbi:MAG: DUF2171 domain-containing protein [Chloroflexia bacterium]|nr:DUF2171 domain-containing protein [Chloroflexia bacterium]
MDTSKIKDHMAVVGSNGEPLATVDHLDAGNTIKLTKDEEGHHHWIPLAWVARIDREVHLDRPGELAKEEWSDSSPADL